MTTSRDSRSFMSSKRARILASILNMELDGWAYNVVTHASNDGLCYVEVYDEFGIKVGNI